jgi:diguanylate cyclase (GGDEF)-like protein
VENQYEMVNGDVTPNENAPRREVTAELEVQSVAPVTGSGPILPLRRLVQMLWAASCFFFVATLTGIAAGIWKSSLIGLVAFGALLMALWLARKGYVQRATAMMLGTLTLSVSYLSFLNQGIDGPGVIAFPAILLLAGMFSSRRGFLMVLALMFSVLTVILVANMQGWHVNVVSPPTPRLLIVVLAVLSMTAFFVWLVAADLRDALLRLNTENERIRESHARIDVLAHHDSLTGLPNRVLARDRFEQAVALARRNGQRVALVFLDLDDFKTINDSLGHATGDSLLCQVASRIANVVRASDTVSRQGGDEFLMVLGGLTDRESAMTTAVKVIEMLSSPFEVSGLEMLVTCSLGIALYPDDGLDFDTLLKNADVAMYRAKDSGRNAFRFYQTEMLGEVVDVLHLMSGIRSALTRGEFRLHYQPQYELKTGRIIGAEALIRWRHPDLGFIPPSKFIPIAERSGLIHGIGAWVLKEACGQAKQWQEAGLRHLVVSVNVSPVQFRRDEIEREVTDALLAAKLSPNSIELELTESLMIAEASHLGPVLDRLRDLGVRFSIDDFGTGYCNLGYLRRFDVERLKIDQSFVRHTMEDPNAERIVRAIIEMAHILNLELVAEGVEDQPTLNRLIELGCEFGQGFHWSPALPADELFDFVRNHQIA